MGKANCNENRELSEIITGLEKQISSAHEELKLPATRENPEAQEVLSDVKLGRQTAIIALDKERHLHQQRCPECQKGD
jgi:hypothetical protein